MRIKPLTKDMQAFCSQFASSQDEETLFKLFVAAYKMGAEANQPKWRPITDDPPKIGSQPHDLFHGKWILGMRVIKYKDGPVIERKVIRWTEQYPYTKGAWMVAEYYEEDAEIASCETFNPTHWLDMDEELPYVT